MVRDGFSEKVTHEVRPEGGDDLVVGSARGRGFRAEGTARAKALPQEGLKRPCVKSLKDVCDWKGE